MKKLILTVAAVLAAEVFAMPAGFTDDWDAALKKAAAEKKTVLALFTGSDWCIWCKRLEGEVLSQKAFSDEVGKTFVPVFLDFPSDKSLVPEAKQKRNRELAEKYAVQGFPTVLLLNARGEVVDRTGYREVGPEKYLAYVNHLVQFAPELKKHIKPYEKKLEALFGKLDESANAIAEKVKGDRTAKEKAVKAAFPTLAGPLLAEMKALREDITSEAVPTGIAEDKAELLKRLDGAIEFLTKASKGQMP